MQYYFCLLYHPLTLLVKKYRSGMLFLAGSSRRLFEHFARVNNAIHNVQK